MAAQPAPDSIRSLEQARQRILQQIASLGDLRPGPLAPALHQVRQAGLPLPQQRPSRPRALLPAASPPRRQQRTTRTVPPRGVAATQAQVAECRRLRRLVAELIEISERLCDARAARPGRQGAGLRKKKACAPLFGPAIEAEIDRFITPGAADALDFEAIETHVRRRALELAARAVEQRLNADREDYRGPAAPCACGQAARYAGTTPQDLRDGLGER